MASTQLYHDASAGNQKTWTFSAWVKRGGFGAVSYLYSQGSAGNNYIAIYFGSADDFRVYNEVSSNQTLYFRTNRLFRDVNAWMHVVVRCDTTQQVTSNRFKIWINGVQETSFSSAAYPALNSDTNMSANTRQRIGVYHPAGSSPNYYWNGLMSHVHLTDGNAYDASFFGSQDATTGEWKINTSPSVTYGTNGFFILKDGNSGTDQSGQSNTFSISGTLSKTEDNPSNVFAVFNYLYNSNQNLDNGNTSALNTTSTWQSRAATLAASSGKWYAEYKISKPGTSYHMHGVEDIDTFTPSGYAGSGTNGIGLYSDSGETYINGSSSAYGATYTTGDIIGIALDVDNGKVYFAKNNQWQNNGVPTSGATGTGARSLSSTGFYTFTESVRSTSGNNSKVEANFGNGAFGSVQLTGTTYQDSNGQGIFFYQPPTNFLALCTKNLNI